MGRAVAVRRWTPTALECYKEDAIVRVVSIVIFSAALRKSAR